MAKKNSAAVTLGKLGGQSQSPAKRSASAQNGRKLKERAEALETACALIMSVSGDPVVENILRPLLPLTTKPGPFKASAAGVGER